MWSTIIFTLLWARVHTAAKCVGAAVKHILNAMTLKDSSSGPRHHLHHYHNKVDPKDGHQCEALEKAFLWVKGVITSHGFLDVGFDKVPSSCHCCSHGNIDCGLSELCGSRGVVLTHESQHKLQNYARKRQVRKPHYPPSMWQPGKTRHQPSRVGASSGPQGAVWFHCIYKLFKIWLHWSITFGQGKFFSYGW